MKSVNWPMRALISGMTLFTLAVGCSRRTPAEGDIFNQEAALPAGMPVPALDWRLISSSVDRHQGTISALTGNDLAIDSARSGARTYPEGSVLALITWNHQGDPHWFGARIAGRFETIETVSIERGPDGQTAAVYKRFAGDPLTPLLDDETSSTRKVYILGQHASVMP